MLIKQAQPNCNVCILTHKPSRPQHHVLLQLSASSPKSQPVWPDEPTALGNVTSSICPRSSTHFWSCLNSRKRLKQLSFHHPLLCPSPVNLEQDGQLPAKFHGDAGSEKKLLVSLSFMKSQPARGKKDFLTEGRAGCLALLPPGTNESAREGRYARPKCGGNHQLELAELSHEAQTTLQAALTPQLTGTTWVLFPHPLEFSSPQPCSKQREFGVLVIQHSSF